MATLHGAISVHLDQLDLFSGSVAVANPTTYRIDNGTTYDEFQSYVLAPFTYDAGSGQLNGGAIQSWLHYLSDGTLAFLVSFSPPYPAMSLESFRSSGDTQGFVADVFSGLDILLGSAGDDYLDGSAGTDYLYGGDGDDTLVGGAGFDELGGGKGANLLIGGADSDNYYVDSPDDTIIEEPGGGDSDAVYASVDILALADGVENLYISTAAVGVGNDLNNTITAYPHAYGDIDNRLSGKGGNDIIHAEAGDDTLQGGAGNDSLYGGTGVDLVDLSDAAAALAVTLVQSETDTVLDLSKAGLGVDTYQSAEGLIGSGFADTLTGSASGDVLHGGGGGDSLIGGAGDDTLRGGVGNDTLKGDAGIDVLDLGGGTSGIALTFPAGPSGMVDLTAIGLGVDSYNALEGVLGTSLGDTLTGADGDNLLGGAAGDDSLAGAGGNDTLVGATGNDSLDGGTGIDVLDLSGATAGLSLTLVQSASNTSLDLTAVGLGKDVYKNMEGIVGSQFDDTLTGTAGDDFLKGLAGIDYLYGGNGNDTLDGADWSVLRGDAGDDLLLGGYEADDLAGGDGNDTLVGGAQRDTLTGGQGADSMAGGDADDRYFVDDVGDTVTEVFDPLDPLSSDSDQVDSTVDIVALFDHVERLMLMGNAVVGVGNATDNLIVSTDKDSKLSGLDGNDSLLGRTGDDTLDGGSGDDNLTGDNGADSLAGGAGNDLLSGAVGDDTIMGDAGNDTLNGGAGLDSLVGGAGNDRLAFSDGPEIMAGGAGDDEYYVDDVGDIVIEAAGEGNDTVYSLLDIVLSDGVENALLLLAGLPAINATGNSSDNNIVGSSAANVLDGQAGADTLDGRDGDDTLIGGTGDDTFVVGPGQDKYENAVIEKAGEGTDTLQSAVSVSALAENIENLTLMSAFEGVGNELDNVITVIFASALLSGLDGNDTLLGHIGDDTLLGGSGNDLLDGGDRGGDTLDGGLGEDTLTGGEGDDLYVQDSAGDLITESGTTLNDELRTNQVLSAVLANIEHYTFTGSIAIDFTATDLANRVTATNESDKVAGLAGNDTLAGLGGSDTLIGDVGDDLLDGGAGADSLVGGRGNDTYWIDDAGDVISDAKGFDILASEISIDLSKGSFASIEQVFLAGLDDLKVIGSSAANRLVGNDGGNELLGLAGDDSLDGWLGNDSLDGGVGSDLLLGFDGDDTLVGGAGNDGLAGEAGNNLLFGGAGADIYGYDPFSDGADTVHTGDNGVDHVLFFGSNLWDWAFDRIGNDLLITALTDASDVYDESQTLCIVGQYSGTGIAYFEADFGIDGNLFYGGDPGVTRVYTPGTLTGKNQGANAELIAGTDGDDKIVGNGGQSDWLFGGDGNDSIVGGSTAAGSAWLFGNAGNDTLGGGIGNNFMIGGDGDDLYIVDSSGDAFEETGSDANDELRTFQALAGVVASIEHYSFTGTTAVNFAADGAANRLAGTAKNDTLLGAGGNDTLDGKAGVDSLAGGAGDDTYVVDNAKDALDESTGSGTDTVQSMIAYALGSGLENLTLLGSAAINGTGNELANALTGNKGANKLDGKDGADTMAGNGGSDTYLVTDAGDQVIETIAGASGGTDLVLSAVSFDLSQAGREQVENLTLTGTDDVNGKGNGLANTLTGNAGANLLDGQGGADKMAGGLGDDTYVVDLKTDIVTEALNAGTDTVQSFLTYVLGANLENLELQGLLNIDGTGNAAANKLVGNDGNNRLDGKAGADSMAGGLGNDTYIFDNAGDTADEGDGGGIDTIVTPFAMALGIEFENLTLTGAAGVTGTGNALANTILGNSGANLLDGQDNSDSLAGGAGNDTLVGGVGNDTLDGGAGLDNLTGGAGNDTYVVDNAKDVVTEAGNGGTDTVRSGIAYVLGAEVENLTLTGAGAIAGTGNALDNIIVGNTGANILMGGAGHDTLDGGAGADKLTGGADSDLFLRHSLAEGKDTITDFQTGAGGDVLDISDLLIGYSGGHEAEFVQCVTAGGNTTVKVDADGLANGSKFADICVLTGVTTDLATLVNDGNIQLT